MRAFSFVGDSGVGKTTLISAVVRALSAENVGVAALKHSKGFADPDPPEKDSARLRAAGASRVVLASPERTLAFWDHEGSEPTFEERAALAGPCEILLVESYGTAGLPSIEVLRGALPRRRPRLLGDPRWVAIASDFEPEEVPASLPRFSLEDAAALARFLLAWRPTAP